MAACRSSVVASCAVVAVCLAQHVAAQDLSRYRAFKLGGTLASVATSVQMSPSASTSTHVRPALLQVLDWAPSRLGAGTPPTADPVAHITFSFCDDQLYQLIVEYRRDRTDGLSDADLVAQLTGEFGAPVPRSLWRSGRPASLVEVEAGVAVARWEDASQHAVALYRDSLDRPQYRLLIMDTGLSQLARAAAARAFRLDAQEAPDRERARQQKADEKARAASGKRRTGNQGGFRP